MSIICVKAEIQCDRCKVVASIFASNLTEVRKRARRQGWCFDPSGRKDWCINCATRRALAPRTAPNTPDQRIQSTPTIDRPAP